VSNNGTNSAFGGHDGKTLIVVVVGTNAKTVAMTVPGLAQDVLGPRLALPSQQILAQAG